MHSLYERMPYTLSNNNIILRALILYNIIVCILARSNTPVYY